MNSRREFLKTSVVLGAAVSLAASTDLFAAVPASDPAAPAPSGPKPILAAVRDGERIPMLDKAIAELGGMGAFVKPGQTVVIKPNIGWDAPPERGANTHPDIVAHLTKLCLAAGAKSVSVFDNTCDAWRRTYTNSGIEKAARDAGAIIVNGKDETLYRPVSIPGGEQLKDTKVHSLILDCDVFINVPVLKHHSGSLMTGCMKNLMGCIWDRKPYHSLDLHQCIADFLTFKKPTLNILDAYHPMVRNGPRGKTVDDVVLMKTLLASTDIVAINAAATRLLNTDPSKVRHVSIGHDMKLGTKDLANGVDVRRLSMA